MNIILFLLLKKTKAITKLILIFILSLFVAFFLNISPQKLLKIALCTMGKEENLYVKEFIEYYKNLGVDHIFIYDDNDNDKENFSYVINSLNYKDLSIFPSIDHSQSKSFTKCYNDNKNNFDWFLMLDLDEFLFIKSFGLKQYLSQLIFKKCDFISFHWAIPDDNNLIRYENKSLFERFPGPYKKSRFIKTAIRGKIKSLRYSVHAPAFSPLNNNTCNNIGKIIYKKHLNEAYITPINIDEAFIIHFKYKSTEEYINKYKKGYYNISGPDLELVLKQKLTEYLTDNKITKQKLEFIEKELNINLTDYKKFIVK